jgi:hypothetical protein
MGYNDRKVPMKLFRKTTLLDEAKNRLLARLVDLDPAHPEYSETVELLTRLDAVASKTQRPKISGDTMLLVLGNVLGIVIIVAYEQKHVFASQAKSFLLKAK